MFPAQRYYRLTFSIVKLEKPANNPNTEIQLRHWKEIEIYIFDDWLHCQFLNFSLLEQDLNLLIWNFQKDQGEKVYLCLSNFDDPCIKCCIKVSKEAEHVGSDRKCFSDTWIACLFRNGIRTETWGSNFRFFSVSTEATTQPDITTAVTSMETTTQTTTEPTSTTEQTITTTTSLREYRPSSYTGILWHIQ